MSIPSLRTSSALGPAKGPYVLPVDEGETWAIIGSRSIMRFLATGENTNDAFAIAQTRGAPHKPIAPHWHRETHDVFLCTKGSVQVWAGNESRVLYPGDFGSISPGTRHSFNILQESSEFLGLIVPGSWIQFFKEVGEPYDGPLYPALDNRPYPIAKFRVAIEEKGIDIVPDFSYKLFPPNPDPSRPDNVLPSGLSSYFLQGSAAPRYALGSQVCTPLATNVQSGGRFTICSVEGGKPSGVSQKDELEFTFAKTDFLLRVAEGILEVTVNSKQKEILSNGESAFIPRNTPFSYQFSGKYGRFYLFGGQNEGGLERIFQEAGKPLEGVLETYTAFDWRIVERTGCQIGAVVKKK